MPARVFIIASPGSHYCHFGCNAGSNLSDSGPTPAPIFPLPVPTPAPIFPTPASIFPAPAPSPASKFLTPAFSVSGSHLSDSGSLCSLRPLPSPSPHALPLNIWSLKKSWSLNLRILCCPHPHLALNWLNIGPKLVQNRPLGPGPLFAGKLKHT